MHNPLRAALFSACATAATLSTSALAAPFDIVLTPGPGLAGNPAALASFERAAARWESRITSPVTVTIAADLGPLGPTTIGGAAPLVLTGPYDEVRDQLAFHKQFSPDAPLYDALPTGGITAIVPSTVTLDNNLYLTKANAKGMGFEGIDLFFGASDGNITFSSEFAFDYDRYDGVDPLKIDFETAAAHEIGHILGFLSAVDEFAAGNPTFGPYVLDLFRFFPTGALAPQTLADFTNLPRNLMPGLPAETTDLVNHFPMATGVESQASHWFPDDLSGNFIGLMDPTLAFGQIEDPTEADFRAMQLIGWDVGAVPEPSVTFAMALPALLLARRRRQPAVQ